MLKLYFNNEPLTTLGGGLYHFYKKFKLKLGTVLILYAESLNERTAPFRGKVELARFKINVMVRWIYPRNNQEIDLSTSPQNIRLKWNFVNYPGAVLLKLWDVAEPFIVIEPVTGGEYNLAANLLAPSTGYNMLIKPAQNGTLGYFEFSKYVQQQGSKIRFEYRNGIRFRTK